MFISRRGTVASAMSWGTPCPSQSHAIGFPCRASAATTAPMRRVSSSFVSTTAR